MKLPTKKWGKRIFATVLLLLGLPLGLLFNPSLLYGNKTIIGKHTVYHNTPLSENFKLRLNNAMEIVSQSEIYDQNLKIDICLSDNSFYTTIMQKLFGRAYGYGFFNKLVLSGEANYKTNHAIINNYKWNMEQLMVHEATHCYQNNKFGIWDSNPVANHPHWKWEGYAEYASRKNSDQTDLKVNITRYLDFKEQKSDSWCLYFQDGTVSPVNYYKGWIMVQYNLDIKKLSYEELLNDNMSDDQVYKEIIAWYETQK